MIAFKATIINRKQSIKLGIIARSSVEAIRIGIGMMPALDGIGPVGISCTPLRQRKEPTPCAA